ncbi:DEAD/DEAH box helicase [Candidatus Micrarchaeota archaeon]|nr:DEAD/DEAH box helicase [Candidatus Micrarchaeota archaeon]
MNLTPRAYQLAIYHSIIAKGNTLVVLPTGLGKTLIALMLIRDKVKEGRCLFLSPTKPLCKQHHESIVRTLLSEIEEPEIVLISGEIAPSKRKKLYEKKVIVSTPQTIKNDLETGVLNPETANFSLIIFDECHRAIGEYAYTFVADRLTSKKPEENKVLFLGLTASPGGNRQRIKEVMDALKIANVEIRSHEDPDVARYVQKSNVKWIEVDLGDHFRLIKSKLEGMTSRYARNLGGMGFPPPLKHKGQFMQLRERILNIPHAIKYPALVQYSVLLHLLHMTELLETQGIHPLRNYLVKLREKDSKSAKLLLHEPLLAEVTMLAQKEDDHPKMLALIEQLVAMKGKKVIVFAQYRDQIARIESVLNEKGISAKRFVGKKEGVTRKMQEETVADFRDGKFEVMVSSSIGEEGLDIPKVDAVIFYEPIPSEIRSIQRRGRAARMQEGEVIVLMTKGTRDEYYHYASKNREKKMKTILTGMQKAGSIESKPTKKESEKTKTEKKKDDKEEQKSELEKQQENAEKRMNGQRKMTDF